MTRIPFIARAGVATLAIATFGLSTAQAAPFIPASGATVGDVGGRVDPVRYRGGYYGGRGRYGYRRGPGVGGALAAGAALGLIGGALAASAAPRYRYYDDGYAYPAYGYGRPAYGYGYPAYGYGYPAYGY